MVASIPSWTVARSSLWELALIAISAIIFGTLVITVITPNVPLHYGWICFGALLFLTYLSLLKFISISSALAFTCYSIFFFIYGCLFVGLIYIIPSFNVVQVAYWPVLLGSRS